MGLEIDSHRVRFLGRQRTLWGNPVFGKLNDILGTIPVPERLDKEKSNVIEVTVSALQKRACVGIFPEGAILQRRKKFEGKTGTARIALEAGVPIVPVGLLGTDGLWPYGAKMPRLGRKVKMYLGEPIYFDDYHGMQDDFDVVKYVRDVSMQAIRKVSGWYNVPTADIVDLYKYYHNLPKPTI
jgi:1-acyl-sn-glycerol-3-phosphate acyltransferase